MTLSQSTLANALEAIGSDMGRPADDDDSVWFGREMTPENAAELWAAAFADYAAALVPTVAPPIVASTETALATALTSAFSGTEMEATAGAMETAFATAAGALSGGMAPAFTGTPPAGQVGFEGLFTPPYPESHEEAAAAIATAIDTWLKTGTAVPSGGGPLAQWA